MVEAKVTPDLKPELKLRLKLYPKIRFFVDLLEKSGAELQEEIRRDPSFFSGIEFVSSGGEPENWERISQESENLRAKLFEQYSMMEDDPIKLKIAEFLIYSADEKGFLPISVEEVSKYLDVNPELVEKVRQEIALLDPPGVCALNWREMLKFQAIAKEAPSEVLTFIENVELALEKPEEFSKKFGIPLEKIEEIKEYVANNMTPYVMLEPASNELKTTRIDMEFKKDPHKGWQVELHNVPNITISNAYLSLVDDPAVSEEQKRYIRNQIKKARMIIDAIKRKYELLKKVGEYIVVRQKKFLEGEGELEPLTMTEIARAFEVEPSTISRLVKNKLVKTPRGIMNLRDFFVYGVKGVSQKEIEKRIREIVDNEDKSNPLSDSEIAKILKEEGIRISRRTVAKYRRKLRIPPYTQRKAEA